VGVSVEKDESLYAVGMSGGVRDGGPGCHSRPYQHGLFPSHLVEPGVNVADGRFLVEDLEEISA
jgi:hypothetical protein